jgi:ATP-dependent DNA helicase RecG
MVGAGAGEDAMERVRVLAETNDGFVIAEKDLELRGPGEFLGVRQHGLPRFAVADIAHDSRQLVNARDDAFSFVAADPGMDSPVARRVMEAISSRFRDRGVFMDVG